MVRALRYVVVILCAGIASPVLADSVHFSFVGTVTSVKNWESSPRPMAGDLITLTIILNPPITPGNPYTNAIDLWSVVSNGNTYMLDTGIGGPGAAGTSSISPSGSNLSASLTDQATFASGVATVDSSFPFSWFGNVNQTLPQVLYVPATGNFSTQVFNSGHSDIINFQLSEIVINAVPFPNAAWLGLPLLVAGALVARRRFVC